MPKFNNKIINELLICKQEVSQITYSESGEIFVLDQLLGGKKKFFVQEDSGNQSFAKKNMLIISDWSLEIITKEASDAIKACLSHLQNIGFTVYMLNNDNELDSYCPGQALKASRPTSPDVILKDQIKAIQKKNPTKTIVANDIKIIDYIALRLLTSHFSHYTFSPYTLSLDEIIKSPYTLSQIKTAMRNSSIRWISMRSGDKLLTDTELSLLSELVLNQNIKLSLVGDDISDCLISGADSWHQY